MSSMRSARVNDSSLLWLSCLLVLAAGYYIAFAHLGPAIDARHDLTSNISATARAHSELLTALPRLVAAEARLDERIGALDLQADHSTTVARLIRESARIAALHTVSVVQIEERPIEIAAPPPADPHAQSSPFEAIPLDVTLAGSYRDLLATVRALAQAPLAMTIEIATIERTAAADDTSSAEPLTARLHVRVERLTKETNDARPH